MTRSMTQALRRTAATVALAGLLASGAAGLLGCGKYGPPQAYQPGVEEPEEEEGRR